MVTSARTLQSSRYARARWLVLAPHADDETLGAGSLIAEAAGEGRLAGVVYLTDGAGSHDTGGRWLVRLRRREATLALRRLTGGTALCPLFLDWPDAHPHAPPNAAWRKAVRAIATLIAARRVDAIAVTGAQEPHCDHSAFHALARDAVREARRSVTLFAYRVWTAPGTPRARFVMRTRPMPPGRRRHALMAHRSQTSAVFGPGFRLSRAASRMPATDLLHRDAP